VPEPAGAPLGRAPSAVLLHHEAARDEALVGHSAKTLRRWRAFHNQLPRPHLVTRVTISVSHGPADAAPWESSHEGFVMKGPPNRASS